MRKQIRAWLVIALMPMAVFAASPAEQERAQMQREVAALALEVEGPRVDLSALQGLGAGQAGFLPASRPLQRPGSRVRHSVDSRAAVPAQLG